MKCYKERNCIEIQNNSSYSLYKSISLKVRFVPNIVEYFTELSLEEENEFYNLGK